MVPAQKVGPRLDRYLHWGAGVERAHHRSQPETCTWKRAGGGYWVGQSQGISSVIIIGLEHSMHSDWLGRVPKWHIPMLSHFHCSMERKVEQPDEAPRTTTNIRLNNRRFTANLLKDELKCSENTTRAHRHGKRQRAEKGPDGRRACRTER